MPLTIETYSILLPLVFFAGFVDAVAGGGGLISLPAYLFAGLPVHVAYGTNKMAASFGTAIAVRQFAKNGSIRLRPALISAVGAIIGGWFGAHLVMMLSAETVQIMMMICLPIVAVFMLTRKQLGSDENHFLEPKKENIICAVIGIVIGMYDGLFGPGTGTFLLMSFTTFLGYSMVTATANAKVVNLASNVGALITYMIGGKVLYAIGIPCIISAALGNFIGSRMAIKKGSRFIRPVMTFVVAGLFVKILLDFFK
ncbi:sulfite exporter TauE/SafE family protein [Oscillospiraceae bacterium LTW-04]|nr:TSUP family transporter [Oscillospiraceae bacterium MB24-C1]